MEHKAEVRPFHLCRVMTRAFRQLLTVLTIRPAAVLLPMLGIFQRLLFNIPPRNFLPNAAFGVGILFALVWVRGRRKGKSKEFSQTLRRHLCQRDLVELPLKFLPIHGRVIVGLEEGESDPGKRWNATVQQLCGTALDDWTYHCREARSTEAFRVNTFRAVAAHFRCRLWSGRDRL